MPKDIVLVSTANWNDPFWTNNQHMATRLAWRGFRVLYVESLGLRRPTMRKRDILRMVHRLIKAARLLRHPRPNLWVFSPLVLPFHRSWVCRWLNNKILLFCLRPLTRRLRMDQPLIWAYNPLIADLAGSLPHSLLIYHMVDDLSAAPHMPQEAIRVAERSMFQQADLLFPTSRTLQAICEQCSPGKTHYFSKVADYKHFSRARNPGPIPRDLQSIPRPRIGFVGAISSYKVDFDLIATVARARPDWHWVMIGQVGQGQPDTTAEQLQMSNIHLLGPVDYRDLPDYLRGFDLAVLPCPLNDYTRSMFPLKFFEYLAAGKAIVATRLNALAEYANACRVCNSSEHFIQAIEQVLSGDVPDKQLCQELARQHTWENRLDQMLKIIVEQVRSRVL